MSEQDLEQQNEAQQPGDEPVVEKKAAKPRAQRQAPKPRQSAPAGGTSRFRITTNEGAMVVEAKTGKAASSMVISEQAKKTGLPASAITVLNIERNPK